MRETVELAKDGGHKGGADGQRVAQGWMQCLPVLQIPKEVQAALQEAPLIQPGEETSTSALALEKKGGGAGTQPV